MLVIRFKAGEDSMSCSSEEYIEFLRTRRSIRKFKPGPIPKDLLLKVLDTARYAPSAHNSQPWRFIIIDDPIIKDKLSKIHSGAKPLKNAPQGIVVVVDKNVSPDSYLLDGANASIYIQLAAHALGLGSVWIQTMRNIREIQEILELSNNMIPVSILAIGYPNEKPKLRERIPLDKLVFYNKFNRQ